MARLIDTVAVVRTCTALWLAVSFMGGMACAADEPAASSPRAVKINPEHPLAPALEQACKARDALDAIDDYEALFEKKELIGKRLVSSRIHLKLREQPFSVYLQFAEPNQGREVIFVEGKNKGMLLAHETGIRALVGTVSLSPTSNDAMEDNHYPITMIGLRKLVEQVIAQWEEEGKYGETEVKYYPNARIGDTEVRAIESKHPQPRKQFKFHLTRLYIDKQTGLPVRVEQYGFPARPDAAPPVIEEYTYTRLKTNVGLTDRDFDPKNPNYAFP
jgi:outer membrane lipoprotein-sorting protein